MLERTYIHDVSPDDDGSETTIAGHVHELRDLGGILFVVVRDRTGRLQVVVKEDDTPEVFERAEALSSEDVVQVVGTLEATDQAPGGVELAPAELTVINEATGDPSIEISKDVDADLSTRLDERHLDVRKPESRAVFSLRSKAMHAMQSWFYDNEFEEVDTPELSTAGAEGGADLFPVVYYDEEAYLSQSPQLYKQILVASGFDRLFEVGHAFRAEDFGTSRHVSEIAMFDVELGYVEDHHDVMDVQEESLRHTIETVVEDASRELDVLGVDLAVPDEDFPRVTFEEAREILREEYDHVPEDDTDLDTKGERLLGEYFEERGHPAVFVVGYPDEKFYYMQAVPGDDVASRKFDLLYRGQELSSGGQREHDVERLRETMTAQGVDPQNFEFYLEAFQYGVPPHGGYGLGIDRLVQQLAGVDNVKEAILFPRDPDRLEP
ncbi:aspartate--tRNA(Asn) ligase [Halobacterium wangiae]|uniref:aspartate--tRNA(Asn) ligase n=1 Tax=Halobacterium wangiae TaxID=2902623 RepID=UPI001E611BF3|nr:aspartate--tRNA(Asn) ligase [Halobacterium wangiae]